MAAVSPVTLSWATRAEGTTLCVLGLDADVLRDTSRLSVYAASLLGGDAPRDLPALAGSFEIAGDAAYFVPRFPFVGGEAYAVFLDRTAFGVIERAPAAAAPTTEVVAVFPSGPAVPMNLLKWYVQFSAPMREGDASRAVRVRRADTGEPIERVFLPGDTELWDPDRRRLTLLLDPGRIKRGLLPHEAQGYPLVEGVPIVLEVAAAFRDARGAPLRAGAKQRYNVGPSERARVMPALWRLEVPRADPRESLRVTFERPLDRAMLGHALLVSGPGGETVDGLATVGAGEYSWQFTADRSWRGGNYVLHVDARLEDLAGNSIARVFDRDLQREEDTPLDASEVTLPFRYD